MSLARREWSHGGAWPTFIKTYRCRFCRCKSDQCLPGMESDRICPWCAMEVGKRICEGLNEYPPSNFFHTREEADEYSMRRNPSRIPDATRAAVLARDGKACGHCGSTDRPVLDHRLPASRGGLPVESNLWVLCHRCNISKKSRTVEEWLAVGGRINRDRARIDPSTYLQSPLPSSSPAETIPAGTGQPVADLPAGHLSEDPCLSAQLAMGIAA